MTSAVAAPPPPTAATPAGADANAAACDASAPARLPPRPVPTLAPGDAVIIEINGDKQALMWAKKDG